MDKNVFQFLQIAEKLKCELRHSYTTNTDRRESVAEHTWMMSLIAMILFHKTELEIDNLKALKK